MSAITAALSQIDGVAAEGDLVPDHRPQPLELDAPASRSCCPTASGSTRRACTASRRRARARAARHGATRPQSTFLRLIGPPGAGKSQIARAIAYRLWTGRGREVERPARRPVLRVRRAAARPVVGRVLLPLRLRARSPARGGQVQLVDSAFVQAMREGWVVMIDEVNTARDVALLSINATLDGRLACTCAATGETVIAQPGFAVHAGLQPGLWSARPTSPTRGTRGSRPRSR